MTTDADEQKRLDLQAEADLRRRKHSLSLAISAAAPGEAGPITVHRAQAFEAYLRGDEKAK